MLRSSQRGAALMVALLLLVISLLLALTSMQSSQLGESMAGNHRASERALMAAEYGAAEITAEFQGKNLEELDLSGLLGGLLKEQYAQIANTNTYYNVTLDGISESGDNLVLVSTGVVASGNPSMGNVVASRQIIFELGVVGFGNLAAINTACPISFQLASNATLAEGEDEYVDGSLKYKPAVSVGSREEARFVVYSILNPNHNKTKSELTDSDVANHATFVSHGDDALDDGVYHANDVIDETTGHVDYAIGCNNPGQGAGSNRMCNYLGGVATDLAAGIVGDPTNLHEFIQWAMRDSRGLDHVVFHDMPSASVADYDGFSVFENGKINVYRGDQHYYFGEQQSLDVTAGLADRPLLFDAHFRPAEEQFDADGNAIDPDMALVGGVERGEYRDPAEDPLNSGDVVMVKRPGRDSGWQQNAFYFPTTHQWFDLGPVNRLYYASEETPSGVTGYYLPVPYDAVPDDSVHSSATGVTRDSHEFGTPKDRMGGLLVVDGNATFKGSPNFEGLIIVLGDFKVSGGGGDELRGSIIAAPYYHDHVTQTFQCQPVRYDADGGGSLDAIFDREALNAAFRLLSPEAQLAWTIGGGGGLTGDLKSWRERIEK